MKVYQLHTLNPEEKAALLERPRMDFKAIFAQGLRYVADKPSWLKDHTFDG
jgi:hypothetical protein